MAASDEARRDAQEKRREIFFHADDNPHGADLRCPRIHWMGYDLNQCPGVGEWKCMLQEERYGDILYGGGRENLDYLACKAPDHSTCSVYLKSIKKEDPHG